MHEGTLALMILRWLHFQFGITWIGLLYYFNFVQGPFLAEADTATKNMALQQLVPRALWWFRWAAMATFIVGLLMLAHHWAAAGADFLFSSYGAAILTASALGTVMFANVWLVIWPNQKVVIAVAGRDAQAPAAAQAGRRAFLASRTNVLLSIPMLFFMGAARHYPHFEPGRTGLVAWLSLTGIVVAAIESNALFGTQGPTKKPLESVVGVIHAGLVLTVVLFLILRFM